MSFESLRDSETTFSPPFREGRWESLTSHMPSFKYNIFWKEEGWVLSAGKFVAVSYTPFRAGKNPDGTPQKKWFNLAEAVIGHNELQALYPRTQFPKKYPIAKVLTEALGTSPVHFLKVWRGCMYDKWIRPYKELLDIIAYRKRGHNPEIVRAFYRQLKLYPHQSSYCQQALADGQRNLVPLIYSSMLSPQEIRELVGKGAWKKLCRNSMTRNKIIAQYERGHWKTIIDLNNSFLSGVKDYSRGINPLVYAVANRIGKEQRVLTKKDDLKVIYLKVCDTELMAARLGETMNPNWSWKRLQEEHDRMAKAITAMRYPKTFINSLQEFRRNGLSSFTGNLRKEDGVIKYEAVLLDTPYDIAMEGKEMKHCVASYIPEVSRGKYLVYSIRKNGERYSTLGIVLSTGWPVSKLVNPDGTTVKMNGVWKFDQHYIKYDKPVDDKFAKDWAVHLIEKINAKLGTEIKEELSA